MTINNNLHLNLDKITLPKKRPEMSEPAPRSAQEKLAQMQRHHEAIQRSSQVHAVSASDFFRNLLSK